MQNQNRRRKASSVNSARIDSWFVAQACNVACETWCEAGGSLAEGRFERADAACRFACAVPRGELHWRSNYCNACKWLGHQILKKAITLQRLQRRRSGVIMTRRIPLALTAENCLHLAHASK